MDNRKQQIAEIISLVKQYNINRFIFIFILIFISISTLLVSQNIVINEVLYDPTGADTGYEWIELYNAGEQSVNLSSWMIQKAGIQFGLVYAFELFSGYSIAPHSYFLIGEEFVSNTDLTADLAFQNGGTATDGIRIVSFNGQYTDTVLYDSPNSNNLPDDISSPGQYFAPDVDGGNSLARKHDGEDSNNCELDFFECENPTPGEPNLYPVDLAIYELNITEIEGILWLETEVFNLSTEIVDNSAASLEITVNNSFFNIYDLPEILPESYIDFFCELGLFSAGYYIVEITVNYLFDNNLENNSASNSILIGSSPLVLNEVMFKPVASNQEWIEIFNRSDSGYLVDNFAIIDASEGQISFSGSIESQDFLVVCLDQNLLLEIYPDANPDKIVEAESWTALNNTEESLKLVDQYETKFDSTSYEGSICPTNFSIERVNPFSDENIVWDVCQDSSGGTPTLPNSMLPFEKDLELVADGFEVLQNQIEHSVIIKNIGLENITDAVFICSIILDDDIAETEIYQQEIAIFDSLLFTFITEITPIGYTTFKYEIISIEDLNEYNDIDFSFYNNNALPFVVNEIMYNPNEEEPEWLELKINYFIFALEEFFLIVDEDTLSLPFSDNEYILVTNSNEDVQFLQSNYDLENIPIFTGLSSLSNNGEQISIIDECNNLIESFFYISDWNDDLKGISIERVNPRIIANLENWGPAVNVCTPGTQNSIFVQVLPSNVKLSVNPNPFSPYQSERTIFSFKLPEKLSRVTIRIFDLKGRLVKKLVDQTLQASEGDLIWDGRGDNGKNLPIGVYIVLMEATSRESEKVYAKKTTVVIGK
ncbi:MAG: lamin tail domain-containing protein [Armatimonadetes bacterium]|nr:lamin tail domain-containing protein [Armatimonadota bacterium]